LRAHRAWTLDEVPQSMLLRGSLQCHDRQMSTGFVELDLQRELVAGLPGDECLRLGAW
jgi:hypothetical protein